MLGTIFSKRNFSIFVLLALATEGLWSLWRRAAFFGWEIMYAFGLVAPPGGGAGSVGVAWVTLSSVIVLAAWAWIVARYGTPLFSGPTARRAHAVTVGFIVVISLWFVWSLYSFLYMAGQPAERLTD